ncbi:penicillin acylase family protein [Pseudomonas aeruginosa]|nr:penicillin acylase family protein [Pseudomonas aeruginosa]
MKGYLDRGPYPAGGDHTTLDVSAYGWGQDFDTWLIPAMRLIVDFGQSEPMIGVNSSGQSGNPASPHYADGIDAWLRGATSASRSSHRTSIAFTATSG